MDETTWTIIKWTLIVFATGFVAQFGKELTQWLLKLFGKDKQAEASKDESDKGSKDSKAIDPKIEKKRIKSIQKLEKKRTR